MRAVACLLLVATPLWCHAQASEPSAKKLYQVITEIGMPHLEESLRYATTSEKRCLGQRELVSAFSVLHHEALQGCQLDHESQHDKTISYVLRCEGKNETTGIARWQIGAAQMHGTLEVKLGGKNMTFYQRITATALGDCALNPNAPHSEPRANVSSQ